jgi:predicted TIM-barrel fold metal-dependent hydrolase
MSTVEWIHHLFSADTARFPFYSAAAYLPESSRLHADPLSVYLDQMQQEGIDRAVLVHPEPYGDDHRLVLDALHREPDRLRACAHVLPGNPGAAERLTALAKAEARIVATRFHLHRGKTQYFASFDDAGVRSVWRAAAELGLIVELHIGPDVAEQTRALIAAYPQTPVVIDHFGEPQFGTIQEFADTLALAELPNVHMKLSAIKYLSENAPLYLNVRRFTRQLADRFGAERLLWGGNGTAWVHAHFADWPEAQRALILGGNALRLLNWR